jgi:chromosome segregation ATPase
VRDATAIVIADETLAEYTAEWEESQRLAKEHEQELETLRSGHSHLTSYVRTLEERAQQHDVEHVNMASDMVRLKMDNDTLADDNEGLKFQVVELQKMIDMQPAEVEAKLKAEMDRIMQRNIEVQNENRALKEEMDEMERELVNAKMSHAEVSPHPF